MVRATAPREREATPCRLQGTANLTAEAAFASAGFFLFFRRERSVSGTRSGKPPPHDEFEASTADGGMQSRSCARGCAKWKAVTCRHSSNERWRRRRLRQGKRQPLAALRGTPDDACIDDAGLRVHYATHCVEIFASNMDCCEGLWLEEKYTKTLCSLRWAFTMCVRVCVSVYVCMSDCVCAVSYTHLTLPTKRIV